MYTRFTAIFDMDGVLVDTYHAHYASWKAMAARYGKTMTESQFAATFGRTSREVIAAVWRDEGLDKNRIGEMDRCKEEIFRELFLDEFRPMPGVVGLLHRLRDAGVALAVGSSAPRENVEQILDQLRARPLFGAIVCGSDVRRGKPDPEIFLRAAMRLGTVPPHCMVIEDAPLGIAAARRAGMACIGLASTGRTRSMLAAADEVVDSLKELSPRIVRSVIRKRREKTCG